MRSLLLAGALLGALAAIGCESKVPEAAPSDSTPIAAVGAPVDSGFASAPDSAWVAVEGPTIVAFYPIVSNDSLEADEGLAAALDDLAYHLGTAMDSLIPMGFTVQYRGGDTLWLRSARRRARVVRAADSADVGYVFADSLGRQALLYGVRTWIDLLEYAREFKRTGTVAPR